MTTISHIAKRPSLFKLMLEGRSIYELGAFFFSLPLLQATPRGDGHPVVVLPGFMASFGSTLPLRTYLSSRGYDAHDWGQGRNYGRGIDPIEGVTMHTNTYALVKRLHQESGQKVSLIGWSLGGIYARELARLAPEAVRQVITLGSPFTNNNRANNVVRLFEMISGHKIEDIDVELRMRMRTPPPVPSTAVFSRTDGIAAWECCVEQTSESSESIEVESSHTGLGHNPLVIWVIMDRLAQPETDWKPFDRSGLRALIYKNPDRKCYLGF